MSGTKEGGLQAVKTNYGLYGNDFYRNIGKQGGSVRGIKKGFALMDPEKRTRAGAKGGSISRRGKNKPKT